MIRRFRALCAVIIVLAGCTADPRAPVVQSNEVSSYWFKDQDPARSAEPSLLQ
jgi:hypothetical protein